MLIAISSGVSAPILSPTGLLNTENASLAVPPTAFQSFFMTIFAPVFRGTDPSVLITIARAARVCVFLNYTRIENVSSVPGSSVFNTTNFTIREVYNNRQEWFV
jgi:hypothetical protein